MKSVAQHVIAKMNVLMRGLQRRAAVVVTGVFVVRQQVQSRKKVRRTITALIFGTTARLDWSQFRTWRGVVEACAGVTLVEHSSAVLCPEVRYVYTSYYAVHSPGEVFTEVHERFTKLQRHYPVLCPEVRACREVRTCDAWGMLLEPVLTHDGNRRFCCCGEAF